MDFSIIPDKEFCERNRLLEGNKNCQKAGCTLTFIPWELLLLTLKILEETLNKCTWKPCHWKSFFLKWFIARSTHKSAKNRIQFALCFIIIIFLFQNYKACRSFWYSVRPLANLPQWHHPTTGLAGGFWTHRWECNLQWPWGFRLIALNAIDGWRTRICRDF